MEHSVFQIKLLKEYLSIVAYRQQSPSSAA